MTHPSTRRQHARALSAALIALLGTAALRAHEIGTTRVSVLFAQDAHRYEIEVVTDMTKSRLAGFHEYQPTLRSFLDLFARLRAERLIPAREAVRPGGVAGSA